VRRWNAPADGPLTEAALRARLEALGYVVARYVYPPGTRFPDHAHDVDKIDAVVSGCFRIVIGGHTAALGPGDWVEVPRGRRHNATVIGDVPVVSLGALRLTPWRAGTQGPGT
jgi:mannose-6-phosphate isomerase-like protein (cupin superfamily)